MTEFVSSLIVKSSHQLDGDGIFATSASSWFADLLVDVILGRSSGLKKIIKHDHDTSHFPGDLFGDFTA